MPPNWAETLKNMLNKAATDPEGFSSDAKVLARRLDLGARVLRARIKQDPSFLRNGIRNAAIKGIATKLKEGFEGKGK